MKDPIVVSVVVAASLESAWACWTEPEHIIKWAFASDDWYCPGATNDLAVGGHFSTLMSARGSSDGFDFNGDYTEVELHKRIAYTMEGGRRALVTFEQVDDGVLVTEVFEPEYENTPELQRVGWQAILDNFRKHAENISRK